MTVILALRKNDDRITARAIQWWTNSIYSHCELIVGDLCYSSSPMDGGVRAKTITMTSDKWDFIELRWAHAEAIQQYFKDTDHHKYGWGGLVTSQLFNLNRSSDKSQFCSQWCAAAAGLPNAASYGPASLAELVLYINEVTL